MLHDPECANSDTSDPIRDTAGLLCAQSSCGHGVRAGEEAERARGGNGAFGFTAFVMRALPRARQRSKEQLGVKRRQDGTAARTRTTVRTSGWSGNTHEFLKNNGKFCDNAIIHTLCGQESQFSGDKIQSNIAKQNASKLISKLLCITA